MSQKQQQKRASNLSAALTIVGALLLTLLVLGQLHRGANAFRSGAPSMACFSMRPFHGLNRPKPASASQFFVRQSSFTYAPNENITVELLTQSEGRTFRGFMVQSYDPANGRRIGEFLPSDSAKPMSCAAATHRNHEPKRHVTITWRPLPSDGTQASGQSQPTPVSDEELGTRQSLANIGNWLGLSQSGGGSATGGTSGVQKRFWSGSVPAIESTASSTNSSSSARAAQSPTAPPAPPAPGKQVRFRATIVVAYDDYYTGFESSDLSFARFDYVPKPTSK